MADPLIKLEGVTKVFYTELGDGASVEAAFDSALESIKTAELQNVYAKTGDSFDQSLFPASVDFEGELTVEGQGDWDKYFKSMSAWLLRQQRADGSWQGDGVGTTYGTAIALTILQLPYAYLPIYQR